MMKRLIVGLMLLAVWAMGMSAQGASLPFMDRFQPPAMDAETVGRPEPATLKPNWWRYFEVSGPELTQNIQATLARLEGLLEELPPETAAAARPFIERIRNNLQALPEARAQPTPAMPTPPVHAESYTISQLLDVAERLRQVQAELQAERDEAATAERTIRAANQRIDTLLAAYLNLAPTDPERVLRGLEIMADRSAVAVATERLRVTRATLAAHEALVRQLAEEQAVAERRLVAERADLTRLNMEIAQAQAALEQAQERVARDRSAVLSITGDDPEAQATARYRQQRVVRSEVLEAIARVRLIKLQAEYQLISLLLDAADIEPQALREQLSGWRSQLDEIRVQAALWARDSERERGRANELLAAASREQETTLTFMQLLHQDRLNLAQETLIELQRLEGFIPQANLLIEQVDKELTRQIGGLLDWWVRTEQVAERIWDTVVEWATASLFKIGGTPVTALGLLRVVFILFIAWWISHVLRRTLKRFSRRREGVNESALYTMGRLSHYALITIGFMVALASVGIDFTNFALVAGALSIGIGFGLQSIVSNFVSGLILLFERSLKVGDFVELASGVAGEVREINVRSTRINTNDNIDIVVPNSEFMNNNVTNWTLQEGYCRIHLPFKVAYGTDKELVRKAGLEAAEKLPYTLKIRNPGVWLVDFGENSLKFELVVWITPNAVKRPGAVNAAYMWEIESALRKYGIQIPLPQRDLHLKSGFQELFQAGQISAFGGEETEQEPLSRRLSTGTAP